MLVFHVDMNFVSLRETYLLGWLQELAQMGYTAILWELEDKVRWETCPECADPEAMSKRSFRRLLERARDLGLENIPLLQTIGHAEYVLKHPRYDAWREDPAFHDCYCVSNAEVRRFLVAWINEYCELFDGLFGVESAGRRQFHLGGDEAYRFASCPSCRRRAEEVGRHGLYAEHVGVLAEGLMRRGITPGIWADMVLADPERIDAVPAGIRFWDWNYWDGVDPPRETRVWGHGRVHADDIDSGLREAVPELLDGERRLVPFHSSWFLGRTGREVIVCGASRSSGDSPFYGRHEAHGPNVVGAARAAQAAGLAGACVTSWAIRVHPWETQLPWIRMAALAWQHPRLEYPDIEDAVARSCFGIGREEFLVLQNGLGATFPFARGRESGIQFDGLKDPVPPPAGYISELLRQWRDDPPRLDELSAEFEESAAALDAAAVALRRLVVRTGAHADLALLDACLRAVHLQTWAARFGKEILSAEEDARATPGLAEAVAATRRYMASWAQEWMTPGYAERVAGLIYTPILDYCRMAAGS